MHQQLWTLHMG